MKQVLKNVIEYTYTFWVCVLFLAMTLVLLAIIIAPVAVAVSIPFVLYKEYGFSKACFLLYLLFPIACFISTSIYNSILHGVIGKNIEKMIEKPTDYIEKKFNIHFLM